MWRSYLGNQSRIIGIDIEPACRQYKSDGVDILIGDQGDRRFWTSVRKSYPSVDVLIDDGGHTPEQQMTTLEEMLPHLDPVECLFVKTHMAIRTGSATSWRLCVLRCTQQSFMAVPVAICRRSKVQLHRF